MSSRANQRASERTKERKNERTSKRTNERTNELLIDQHHSRLAPNSHSRISSFYLLNVWSLSTLFSLMTCLSYAIDTSSIGDRQATLLSLLLSQIAVKFAFADA